MKREKAAELRVAIICMSKEGHSQAQIAKELNITRNKVRCILSQFRENPEIAGDVNSRNRSYTYEFKSEAVRLHLQEGMPIIEVTNKLGITSYKVVMQWCSLSNKNGGILPLPKKRGCRPTDGSGLKAKHQKEDRLRELEQRNQQLEMENDLLKKLHQELRR